MSLPLDASGPHASDRPSGLTRRDFLIGGAAAAGLLVAGGCGGGSDDSTVAAPSPAPPVDPSR